MTEQKPEIGEALNGIVEERLNKSKGCSKQEQKVLKRKDTNGKNRDWKGKRTKSER